MSDFRITVLQDRGLVRVAGEDAPHFLDNLVTNDLEGMTAGEARFAALLSPQGKILFDFLVLKVEAGFLLDVARDKAPELVKRLALYKLRAKVDLADLSNTHRVWAAWGDALPPAGGATAFRDPRSEAIGWRLIALDGASGLTANAGEADYHAHRIALGVPEGGKDYAFGDAYPHEANMDRTAGVSFTKGCFVGQEVVARMQHKTVVRKRATPLTATAALASGAEVLAGDVAIGKVGSVAGHEAIAMVRLDRAIEALDKGTALTADGRTVTLSQRMLDAYRHQAAHRTEQA